MAKQLTKVYQPFVGNYPIARRLPDPGLSISEVMIQAFYIHCLTKNLSPKSIKDYGYRLKFLWKHARSLGKELSELTHGDIKSFILSRVKENSPDTINGFLKVFRVFFRFCKGGGFIGQTPTDNISNCKTVQRLKHVVLPHPLNLLSHQCAISFCFFW